MSDTGKLFAIATMCLTAVLLLCTIVILDKMPASEAYASGPSDRQGDYIILPGETNRGQEQVVYVIDIPAKRLAAYYADINRKEVKHVAVYKLEDLVKRGRGNN